jgi:predicted transcriptional regulator
MSKGVSLITGASLTKNAGGGRNEPIASQVMYYSVTQKTFLSNALAAMKSTVTVRLDDDLDRELSEVSDALGRSRSEIVRDALRRQLSVLRFEELRKQVMPFAEARGYLTDEDVFEEVS